MKHTKLTAVAMAAALGMGCLPLNVLAADSYKEAEKAAVTKAIETFCARYAEGLEKNTGSVQNSSNIQLMLSEEGSTMLNLASDTDLSWLNSVTLNMKNGFTKESSAQSFDLNVNGNKICTLNCYVDVPEAAVYINIPELNEGYIKADLVDVDTTDSDDTASLHAQMQYSDLLQNYFNGLENLPDADTLQAVLERYSSIIIDHVTEQGSSSKKASAGDVEEQFTVLEAELDQPAAAGMVQEMLETAKEDKDLESVVKTLAELSDQDFSYEDFLMSLEDMETELSEDYDLETDTEEPEEETSTEENIDEDEAPADIAEGGCVQTELASENTFILRSYVNGKGEIAGRELSAKEGRGETALLKYLKTENDSQKGFLLSIGEDTDGFTMEGSGTEEAGTLNGYYTVSSGGEELAMVDVVGLDTEAFKDGYLKGGFYLSGTGEGENDALNGMLLSFTSDSTKDKLDVNASLSIQNTYLGTIYFTSENKEDIDLPDKDSIKDVYDFSKEEDIEKYVAGMDMDTIMENLDVAGMPEGWLEDMTGEAEEESELNDLTWDIETETGDELMQLQTTEDAE